MRSIVRFSLMLCALVATFSFAQSPSNKYKVKDVMFETETGTGNNHASVWFRYYDIGSGESSYGGFWIDDSMGKAWLAALLTAYNSDREIEIGITGGVIGYFSTFNPVPPGYQAGYVKAVKWIYLR